MFRKTLGAGFALNGGVRDSMSAWPDDIYSAYNDMGEKIRRTLCLPPKKCGVFRKIDPSSMLITSETALK